MSLPAAILAAGLALGATNPIRVVDDTDRSLELGQAAQRILALSPHGVELVFAAGAGAKLVGRVRGSDYPPQALSLPEVGDAARIDQEAVLALDPDLVIGWHSGNGERDLSWIAGRGIALYRSDPPTLEAIAKNIEDLGRLAGTWERAQQTAAAFRERLDRLRRHAHPDPPLRVFYQLWPEPLMSLDRRHLVGQVLALCGGLSLFPALPGRVAAVDEEAVIAAAPEVIVTATEGEPEAGDDFARWRRWPDLPAQQPRRFIQVPADLMYRPGPRLLDAAERLCQSFSAIP